MEHAFREQAAAGSAVDLSSSVACTSDGIASSGSTTSFAHTRGDVTRLLLSDVGGAISREERRMSKPPPLRAARRVASGVRPSARPFASRMAPPKSLKSFFEET